MTKLLVLALGALWLSAAGGRPDFSGLWKRQETGRASLSGPRELTLTIQHREPVLRYRAQGVVGINSPFVEELEFRTTGTGTPEPGQLGAVGNWEGAVLVVRYVSALLHDPEVIIFDEPLSGLDVVAGMIFKSLVHALAERGRTILYSSHVLEVVERICTRVLILRQGQVIAHDSVENLRQTLQSASLEDVFAQLVEERDTAAIAREMAAVIGG